MTSRLRVHVALASILLAFFAPLVSWVLVLGDRRSPPSPWKRRLVAIALADTVLVAALGLAVARGVDLGAAPEAEPPPPIAARAEVEAGKGRALFDPIVVEEERGEAPRADRRTVVGAAGLELVLILGLVVWARRRRASPLPGLAVLGALLALMVASSAVLAIFAGTMGVSLGALLVAIASGSAALLLVGLVALLATRPPPVTVGRPLRAPKAVALGVLYGVTGATRVTLAAALIATVSGFPLRTAADAFALDLSWGPLGVGIFLAATVVLAPVAEELVFRGILLPWLTRWMRPAAALAWSTLVFALGHLYYGLGALLIAHYGLVLGWARLRTGKLVAPIALHVMLNGSTAVALLAASS